VELLVVIAIISILASLLLPALERAVSQARAVSCLSNQRQIGMAVMQLADDYNGFLPAYKGGGVVPTWYGASGIPYYSGPENFEWSGQQRKKNGIWCCPEDPLADTWEGTTSTINIQTSHEDAHHQGRGPISIPMIPGPEHKVLFLEWYQSNANNRQQARFLGTHVRTGGALRYYHLGGDSTIAIMCDGSAKDFIYGELQDWIMDSGHKRYNYYIELLQYAPPP
jgi:type II secretory pathway pseudopilin PulG